MIQYGDFGLRTILRAWQHLVKTLDIIDRKHDATACLATDAVLASELQYHSFADRKNSAG